MSSRFSIRPPSEHEAAFSATMQMTSPMMVHNVVLVAELDQNHGSLDTSLIKRYFYKSETDQFPGKVVLHIVNPSLTMLIFRTKILIVGAKSRSAASTAVTRFLRIVRQMKLYTRDADGMHRNVPIFSALRQSNMQVTFDLRRDISLDMLAERLRFSIYNPGLIRLLYLKVPIPVDVSEPLTERQMSAIRSYVNGSKNGDADQEDPAQQQPNQPSDAPPTSNGRKQQIIVLADREFRFVNVNIGRFGKCVCTGVTERSEAATAYHVILHVLADHLLEPGVSRPAHRTPVQSKPPALKRVHMSRRSHTTVSL